MDRCSFEAFGWSCDSRGYLGVAGAEQATGEAYPCPQCNTRVFLEKAYAQVRRKRYAFPSCPCCGPGLPGQEVWSSAVATARGCNPDVAEAVLRELAAVETGPEASASSGEAHRFRAAAVDTPRRDSDPRSGPARRRGRS